MRWLVLCLTVIWSTTLWASHSYGELDLCTLYPERMPPGMPLSQLPQSNSQGAKLTQQYCTQCHNLPGPGRHTAEEWLVVMETMNLLMDVASRFGGLLGKVEAPSTEERKILERYLVTNALQPFNGRSGNLAGRSFEQYCANCHALPAPSQHSTHEWPQVIKRMQRNMDVMKHEPLSPEVLLQIQRYLQQYAGDGTDDYSKPITTAPVEVGNHEVDTPSIGLANWKSWLALGPFLLLAVAGLIRWWRSSRKSEIATTNARLTGTS